MRAKQAEHSVLPPLRPTARAIVALLGIICLLILANSIVSYALAAAAAALICSMVYGLAAVLISATLTGRQPSYQQLQNATCKFVPVPKLVGGVWERVDQRGRTVESFRCKGEVEGRGLYRCRGEELEVRDCFGFWLLRLHCDIEREVCIPPRIRERTDGLSPLRALGSQPPFLETQLDTAMVRPYERGDSLRTISWRQTAHHGQLMSFETQPVGMSRALVLVDTTATGSDDALAVEVASIFACLAEAGERPVLTDGVASAREPFEAQRFTAALTCAGESDSTSGAWPAAAATAGTSPARMQARRTTRVQRMRMEEEAHADANDDASRRFAPDSTAFESAALVAGAKRLISADGKVPSRVVVVTALPSGPFSEAARKAFRESTVAVVEVKTDATSASKPDSPVHAPTSDNPSATGGFPFKHLAKRPSKASSNGSVSPANARGTNSLSIPIASLVCAICTLALTLFLAATLIEPASWFPFAGITCTITAIDAIVMPTLIKRLHVQRLRIPLTVALVIGIFIAAVTCAFDLLGFSLHDVLGSLETTSTRTQAGPPIPAPLIALGSIFIGGYMQLIVDQWVPVEVAPIGDAALVLTVGIVACVLRFILASRHARPLLTLLPFALLAIRLVFMGSSDRASWLPLLLACLLFSIALISPRRPWLAQTVLATAVAVALACAITPQTLALARRLPISLDISPNTFSSSTVNPLLDLREDLNYGSEQTALRYTTNTDEPVYLRMSTLSDFDGEVWSSSSSSAEQGGEPFSAIASLLGGGNGGGGAGDSNGNGALSEGSPELTPLVLVSLLDLEAPDPIVPLSAEVTIENLSAQFLPMPTGASSIKDTSAAEDDSGLSSGWRWGTDGSVYGTDAATRWQMSYRTSGTYLAPITDAWQLQDFADLPEHIASVLSSAEDADGTVLAPSGERVDPQDLSAPSEYQSAPRNLPERVQAIVTAAREAGMSIDRALQGNASYSDQLNIMRYLLNYFADGGFSYTLDAPDGNEPGNLAAIDDFLERRSGYCVHYASTLTILARAMGLPARMALGYRANPAGGEGGQHTATNRDLHTWTEVYLTGVGWVPFDVTPGGGNDGDTGDAGNDADDVPDADTADDRTNNERDSANESDPSDTTDQPKNEGGTDATAGNGSTGASDEHSLLGQLAATISLIAGALRRIAPYILGVAAAAILLAAPRVIRRRRRAQRLESVRSGTISKAAPSAWNELTDTALDVGETWPASATEEDIAAQLVARLAHLEQGDDERQRDANWIEQLANAACAVRYGQLDSEPSHCPISVEDLERTCARIAKAASHIPAQAGKQPIPATVRQTAIRASRWILPRSLFRR